jgi:preprotein translocase subunit SecE
VANRKRRGDEAVDERFDDVLDDDLAAEEFDDEFADGTETVDDDLLDDDVLDERVLEKKRPARSRARTDDGRSSLTKRRGPAGVSARSTRTKAAERPNILARIATFIREVVAELRKVIWPTRKELLTYTAVVVVFVSIMVIVTSGLDYLVAKAVLWAFANGDKVATK